LTRDQVRDLPPVDIELASAGDERS
jgi:hypothetical protein